MVVPSTNEETTKQKAARPYTRALAFLVVSLVIAASVTAAIIATIVMYTFPYAKAYFGESEKVVTVFFGLLVIPLTLLVFKYVLIFVDYAFFGLLGVAVRHIRKHRRRANLNSTEKTE